MKEEIEEIPTVTFTIPFERNRITLRDLMDLGWMVVGNTKIKTNLGKENYVISHCVSKNNVYTLYFNGDSHFLITKRPHSEKTDWIIFSKDLYESDKNEIRIDVITKK